MAENGVFGEINFRDVGVFCLGVLSGGDFLGISVQARSGVHHGEWLGGGSFLRRSAWRGLVISVRDVY